MRKLSKPGVALQEVKANRKQGWRVRYSILALIWLGWLLSFLDRMVMSISLPFIGAELDINASTQGLIISAFFTGYALFQIPGGMLADRLGSRTVMGVAIAWWSIFTSLTGLVLSFPILLLVRFLFGIGEGCFPVASWKTISTYFPATEKGRATAIQSTVNTLGPALASVVAASMIAQFGWKIVFIVLGIPGLLIAGLVYNYCYDNPKDHPAMSAEELAENAENLIVAAAPQVTFKHLLGERALWKLAAIWFLFGMTCCGFSAWLPSYLMKIRGFSLMETGVTAAIPFLFGTVGILMGGYLSDKYRLSRKWIYIFSAVVSAVFLYMTFTVDGVESAVLYQSAAAFFMFLAMGIFWGEVMDQIPPNIMGKASGMVNFGGQLAGLISPFVMGFLIDQSGGKFDWAFMFMSVALIASAAMMLTVKTTVIKVKDKNRQSKRI
jgi:sugar phosphate permease